MKRCPIVGLTAVVAIVALAVGACSSSSSSNGPGSTEGCLEAGTCVLMTDAAREGAASGDAATKTDASCPLMVLDGEYCLTIEGTQPGVCHDYDRVRACCEPDAAKATEDAFTKCESDRVACEDTCLDSSNGNNATYLSCICKSCRAPFRSCMDLTCNLILKVLDMGDQYDKCP